MARKKKTDINNGRTTTYNTICNFNKAQIRKEKEEEEQKSKFQNFIKNQEKE